MNSPVESSSLEVHDLTKRYAGHAVVDRVSFAVAPGEVFALVGPSGAGKSTVLRAVAGLIAPDAGRVLVNGTDVTDWPANRRQIGMVFQDYALFPRMTVRQNVSFPLDALAARGLWGLIRSWLGREASPESVGRVDEMLRLVRLEQLGHRLPAQLSGGEQQRVALARALAFEPRLLCLDEPLGALDKNLRALLLAEIEGLQRRLRKTMLYVTHDQAEAMAVADRLAVFNRGRVEQVGAPDELYRRPVNRFVATFLGDCNVFRVAGVEPGESGTVATTPGGTRLACAGERVPEPGRHVVGVRPENLCLDGDRESGAQAFRGRVTAVSFLGPTVRVSVDLPGCEACTVLVPSRGRVPVEPGADVVVGYRPGDVLVLE